MSAPNREASVADARRYAIYFVPAAESALYRFGSATIGYDCISGQEVPPPASLGALPADWPALTEEARKYGFHATLKAPFRLREGASEQELLDAFAAFAERCHTAPAFDPQVAVLGGFVAIVPRGAEPALMQLADDCVVAFEAFRAPLSVEDWQRRLRNSDLDDRQKAHLQRWGYPYVFDQFRFHMTLTGRSPANRRSEIAQLLADGFRSACGSGRIAVDRIALVRQDSAASRFVVMAHAKIGQCGAAACR